MSTARAFGALLGALLAGCATGGILSAASTHPDDARIRLQMCLQASGHVPAAEVTRIVAAAAENEVSKAFR